MQVDLRGVKATQQLGQRVAADEGREGGERAQINGLGAGLSGETAQYSAPQLAAPHERRHFNEHLYVDGRTGRLRVRLGRRGGFGGLISGLDRRSGLDRLISGFGGRGRFGGGAALREHLGEQLVKRDIEETAERHERLQVGYGRAVFPFGNGLMRDVDARGQLLLSHVLLLAQEYGILTDDFRIQHIGAPFGGGVVVWKALPCKEHSRRAAKMQDTAG